MKIGRKPEEEGNIRKMSNGFQINARVHLFSCFLFLVYFSFAERLTLVRQQRAEAAKKREEEKAGK